MFIIIQTDALISARRPNLMRANKKIAYRIMDFDIPGDNRLKLEESEKIDKYKDIA